MPTWPKDNQTARNAFYGDPGKGQIASQMVPVVPPFAMYYEGRKVKSIMFHRKAAASLLAALNEIWDFYGRDQSKIDAAGLSKYNGAYNPRKVRGSATKWSNHAYAAAIDINADQNAMYAAGNMPQAAVDAFLRQGWMWGGFYSGRKDAMHFEATDNGGRKPKSPPPGSAGSALPLMGAAPADELDDTAEPAVLNVQPSVTQYDLAIETLQRKLIQLGYLEVGEVDGKWGGKTRGSVTAFMNDRGKQTDGNVTPAVTDEVSKAINESWTRPIAPARANATAAEVAPKVEAVRQSLWQRLGAKVAAGLGFGVTAISGTSDNFAALNDKVSPIKQFFISVPGWAWGILIVAIAAGIWYSANKSTKATVQDYNSGKIN